MPVIRGTVEKIYENVVKGKYGPSTAYSFVIDGARYSGGFKKWEVAEADEVEVTYKVNAKGYNDITKMDVIQPSGELKNAKVAPAGGAVGNTVYRGKGAASFPIPPLDPARAINRQNALTAAVNFVTHVGSTEYTSDTDTIIKVARIFEAYTTGDMDLEEAKRLIASGEA